MSRVGIRQHRHTWACLWVMCIVIVLFYICDSCGGGGWVLVGCFCDGDGRSTGDGECFSQRVPVYGDLCVDRASMFIAEQYLVI